MLLAFCFILHNINNVSERKEKCAGEVFVTGMVVEQHVLAAAQHISCDTIQSLVHRLPANSLKIGGSLMSFSC